MNPPPGDLQKVLQHIDQLIAQAPDEATRTELQGLRARLNSPEMRDMARELAGSRPANPESLVLEFHDPLLPMVVTATGCSIAAMSGTGPRSQTSGRRAALIERPARGTRERQRPARRQAAPGSRSDTGRAAASSARG